MKRSAVPALVTVASVLALAACGGARTDAASEPADGAPAAARAALERAFPGGVEIERTRREGVVAWEARGGSRCAVRADAQGAITEVIAAIPSEAVPAAARAGIAGDRARVVVAGEAISYAPEAVPQPVSDAPAPVRAAFDGLLGPGAYELGSVEGALEASFDCELELEADVDAEGRARFVEIEARIPLALAPEPVRAAGMEAIGAGGRLTSAQIVVHPGDGALVWDVSGSPASGAHWERGFSPAGEMVSDRR